jgi:hypothetical protein
MACRIWIGYKEILVQSGAQLWYLGQVLESAEFHLHEGAYHFGRRLVYCRHLVANLIRQSTNPKGKPIV